MSRSVEVPLFWIVKYPCQFLRGTNPPLRLQTGRIGSRDLFPQVTAKQDGSIHDVDTGWLTAANGSSGRSTKGVTTMKSYAKSTAVAIGP